MTAQLDLAAPAAAGVERTSTARVRNGADRPGGIDSAHLSAVAPAAPPSQTTPAPPSEAQAIYDATLDHALRAQTLAQVRERFDASDRAMVRLQREGRHR